MRLLLVGDPHVTRSELEDAGRLRAQVLRLEVEEKADCTVYLGDLYDNFGVKDLEVEKFWRETFDGHKVPVVALVGNHDRPGDRASAAHALQVHQSPGLVVVDRVFRFRSLLFAPFYFSAEEFLKDTGGCTGTLICHQSLNGARYDSGHLVDDAVDTSGMLQQTIISGHLHTAQSFGKVWYPGSPRWRTVHDANKDKHLAVVDVDDGGQVVASKLVESECSRLLHVVETEDSPQELVSRRDLDRYVVDIRGSKAFVETRKTYWSQYDNVRIRVMPTEKRETKVKESDGVPQAFRKYVEGFKAPKGTPSSVLGSMLKTRLA